MHVHALNVQCMCDVCTMYMYFFLFSVVIGRYSDISVNDFVDVQVHACVLIHVQVCIYMYIVCLVNIPAIRN